MVPASWVDTSEYESHGESYRGMEILDQNTNQRIENYPWLHNLKIQERDMAAHGSLRKAARLMKSLKYEAETARIEMPSSYDITAIAFNMPLGLLQYEPPHELGILQSCRDYCNYLVVDQGARSAIMVPNNSRPVFCAAGVSYAHIVNLLAALNQLIADIARASFRPFIRLAEARVERSGRFY